MPGRQIELEEIIRGMISDEHALESALCLVVALLDQAGICSVPRFADLLEVHAARVVEAGHSGDGFSRLVASLRSGWEVATDGEAKR